MKTAVKKVVALAAFLVAVGSLVMAIVMPAAATTQPPAQKGHQGQPGNQGGDSSQPEVLPVSTNIHGD